ncbi:hypothetical protein PPYR_09113 [Photinus pyralis]|uniref:Uncharacterized protein n=2 Tax=Photinus pyralis TaxID=7054 RepID=A0A5N4ALA3_PHOPY|nr:beta-1,3-glucan-binding protein-like [Photinus pyralis]KAB0798120.1 hypothetical protein PPYR_09113 [Photinus pyralis]
MLRIIAIVLCLIMFTSGQHQLPQGKVEVLSPSKLKVTVPEKAGIMRVSFFGRVNQELQTNDNGTIAKELQQTTGGLWTVEDATVNLKAGDTLYYRLHFDYFDGKTVNNVQQDMQKLVIDKPILEAPTTSKPTTTTPKCEFTPTMVNGKRSCSGKIIFQEFFKEIAPIRWQTETKFAQGPDYEFVMYQAHAENLFIQNDMLHIRPTLVDSRLGPKATLTITEYDIGENCTGVPDSLECVQRPKAWMVLPPIFSSQITTKYRMSFVYGTIEVRAKLPKGDWIYPQLQLRSKSDYYGPDYDSGLIQIAFAPGNARNNKVLSGGCVFGESVFARNYGVRTIQSTKEWSQNFHIFKLEWRPDGVTLSVDNDVYGNIYPPDGGFATETELGMHGATVQRWRKGSQMAPFDKEMYLMFGVGVGGFTFGNRKGVQQPWDNDDPKAQLNFYKATDQWYGTWSNDSRLIVDYVRIWAL